MKKHILWLAPTLIILALTPFMASWDLSLARHFFSEASQEFPRHPFYKLVYKFFARPAVFVSIGACLLLLASLLPRWRNRLMRYQAPTLMLTLTMLIGSGIVVHMLLKETWGRPRPVQIVEFGGTKAFRAYHQPDFSEGTIPSRSFPSGHVSCGFYFLALSLLGRRHRNRLLFWSGIILALGLGIPLSWARIARGGHFLSDAVLTAWIMWISALLADKIVYDHKEN